MADTKITALTALTAADPINDVIPIVDVSDTSMAASGTTKKISVNNILSSSPTASGALTVTGLVTAGSATITGAATVGTTLGVTGQLSTANVLKTTGNPSLSVAGATEAFVAHNTGYGAILYGQGTTYDAALLDRNTGLRLTVTTSGAQVSGDLSMTSGNVVMATSGKGIDFSATPGTGTSELLNDYEEGTWTGTFTASVGTLTTVTSSSANYTKIGRRVSIDIDFTLTNVGTASGVLSLTLPFTRSSANDTCGAFREISTTGSIGSIYGDPSDLTKVSLSFYNNTSVIVNGYRFNGTYSYNV